MLTYDQVYIINLRQQAITWAYVDLWSSVYNKSQATGHYMSLCWPRSMSPHGITTSGDNELTQFDSCTRFDIRILENSIGLHTLLVVCPSNQSQYVTTRPLIHNKCGNTRVHRTHITTSYGYIVQFTMRPCRAQLHYIPRSVSTWSLPWH